MAKKRPQKKQQVAPQAQPPQREPGGATRAAKFPRVLMCLVALYVLLAGLLAARVPLGKAPDERAHIYYVEALATSHSLPVFNPEGALQGVQYEFHQPPLYYLVSSLGWRLVGPGADNYLCRLVSLLFGAATVVVVFHGARRMFGSHVGVLAAGFIALLPMHINLGASASNDTTAGFFCAALFYLMTLDITKAGKPNWKLLAVIGAAIGLAVLAKTSTLTVALASLGYVAHATWKGVAESRAKAALGALAVTGAVAALLCGPWLARNAILYGDPLAAKIFETAFRESDSRASAFFARGVTTEMYVRTVAVIMFCSFWGFFGGPNTALDTIAPPRGGTPPAAVLLVFPFALYCIMATTLVLMGNSRVPWHSLTPERKRTLLWWLLGMLAVWLAWATFNITYFQAQARYIQPSLLPVAVLAAAGWQRVFAWERLSGKLGTAVFVLVLLTQTLWNAFGWRTLV